MHSVIGILKRKALRKLEGSVYLKGLIKNPLQMGIKTERRVKTLSTWKVIKIKRRSLK